MFVRKESKCEATKIKCLPVNSTRLRLNFREATGRMASRSREEKTSKGVELTLSQGGHKSVVLEDAC